MPALSLVDALHPVTYNWLSEGDTSSQHAGFIAQDVQPLAPDLVSTESNGQLTLNYAGFAPYLTSAIQQLNGVFNATDALTGTSTLKSYYQGTSIPAITVAANGNVGVNNAAPAHTLDVLGEVAAISFINTSTRTAKTNISYLDAASTDDILDQIGNIRIAQYRYKIEPRTDPLRLGLIAEDAAKDAPAGALSRWKGRGYLQALDFHLGGSPGACVKSGFALNTRRFP
jgi:hypothetical protein